MFYAKVLSFILIDLSIAICVEKRYGQMVGYIVGVVFRLSEFGIISVIPLLISIITSNKYKTIIAATLSFFGMKFFTKIVEAFSEESLPRQLKSLRESNARLEEQNKNILLAVSNLPTQVQRSFEEQLARVVTTTESRIKKCEDDIQYLTPFTYQPYDSPSNGS
jgi:hypothetical protein